jgi:hypothetical protein
MDNKLLPPLPGSDGDTLRTNAKARDFWSGNSIQKIDEPKMQKCDHNFEMIPSGVICTKCHFGMLGFFEITNGKLFYEGQPVGI